MGIKKIFKKKEPTEQELVDDLQRVGISTKSTKGRQEKFGAFKQYAHERQTQRTGLAPVNPYASVSGTSNNPYAMQETENNLRDDLNSESANSNLHGASREEPYSSEVKYGSKATSNPYSSRPGDLGYHTSEKPSSRANPYQSSTRKSPPESKYKSQSYENPPAYEVTKTSYSKNESNAKSTRDNESTFDLNDIPSSGPPVQMKRPVRKHSGPDLDLNELPDEDLNVEVDEFLSEQEQVNSEDEEVEAIKQDIRFTKQESVASTRNTLRMAQEAEASGTNTLGMLGSQSERLYNAEQNLLLADTQTKIADEKVRELGRLNRSIFIPATGNPFNKKSRLRQQESKLKAEKMQEKYLRDTNRKGMYASEQRLTQGITSKSANSELFNKYQGEKQMSQAQRYQFENDSEDDEMEKELASNLDQISNYSKKLKSTAKIMGQEVDAQNDRLRRIEEDADRLDINVHLNSSRLNNIR